MNLEEQPDLKGVRIDRRSHVPAGFVPGASSHILCLCSVNLLNALLGYPGLAAAAAAASLWKAREKPHKTRMCEQKHQDVCVYISFPKNITGILKAQQPDCKPQDCSWQFYGKPYRIFKSSLINQLFTHLVILLNLEIVN